MYILGEIFNINSNEGAEILDMTAINFRKILSRARNQLNDFLHENCGLMNSDAKCRCEGKIMHHLRSGKLDPRRLRLNLPDTQSVKDLVTQKMQSMNKLIGFEIKNFYQEMPFFEPGRTVELFKDLIKNPEYSHLFS